MVPREQSLPNLVQTSSPTQGRFLTQMWSSQPDPWGIPNSKTQMGHWGHGRENFV